MNLDLMSIITTLIISGAILAAILITLAFVASKISNRDVPAPWERTHTGTLAGQARISSSTDWMQLQVKQASLGSVGPGGLAPRYDNQTGRTIPTYPPEMQPPQMVIPDPPNWIYPSTGDGSPTSATGEPESSPYETYLVPGL